MLISCAALLAYFHLTGLYIGSASHGLPVLCLAWGWLAGWIAYGQKRRPLTVVALFIPGAICIADDHGLSGWFNYAAWLSVLGALYVPDFEISRTLTRICTFLGDLSYPLYIVHYPVLFLSFNLVFRAHPAVNSGLLQVAIAIAAGTITLGIERLAKTAHRRRAVLLTSQGTP